jgi:hypothetical protein
MQQIRERLLAGETAKDIIAAGFAPGSTYKTQWRLRRDGFLPTKPTRSPIVENAHAPRDQAVDITPELQGNLSVYRVEGLDFPFVYWHPVPPAPCPGCGVQVGHWQMCPASDGFFANECDCGDDADCYSLGLLVNTTKDT